MSRKSIALKMFSVLLLAVVFAAHHTSTLCWASVRVAPNPKFTLEVANEPLRGVLGKISKKTGWKIKAPEKWMEKQVTQTLHEVTLEQGLRFILRDAGVENLLLTYDEDTKVVTVFDTEIQQGPPVNVTEVRMAVPQPMISATVDPIENPGARKVENNKSRRILTRGSRRTLSSAEDE